MSSPRTRAVNPKTPSSRVSISRGSGPAASGPPVHAGREGHGRRYIVDVQEGRSAARGSPADPFTFESRPAVSSTRETRAANAICGPYEPRKLKAPAARRATPTAHDDEIAVRLDGISRRGWGAQCGRVGCIIVGVIQPLVPLAVTSCHLSNSSLLCPCSSKVER
ncbi:hypothetical protein OF83DRAFT_187173 [Amylostereum chailletii]|nr:hypothetical protein OF83DRAFT_187173 [Amylostereum chailletii]